MSVIMKLIFSLLLIGSLGFSQSLTITSPKNGDSFEYDEMIEIKWEAPSYLQGKVKIYWSETQRKSDYKEIDEVNIAEGSAFYFSNKEDFKNSDGEIFLIIQRYGVDESVKIEIAPIIRSRTGSIRFTSRISNVKVSLNGKYEGTTPFTKKEVRFGSIIIKAEKSGYNDNTFTINHSLKNTAVDIKLSQPTGTLRLVMDELIAADIRVNNIQHNNMFVGWRGNAKLNDGWVYITSSSKPTSHRKLIKLTKGNYTVKATAINAKRSAFVREVNIIPNSQKTVSINLPELQGKLKLNFNLSWNRLAVSHEVDGNNNRLSRSDVIPYLPLKYGTHNFIVKSPKYETKKFSVNINSEEIYAVDEILLQKRKSTALRKNIFFPGIILPGTGQLYSENRKRGLIYMAIHVALAYGIYDSYSKYANYSDEANIYKDKYNSAVTNSAIDENWAAYKLNANKANDASKLMITFSSGLVANWLATWFDSLFFSELE